MEFCSLHLRVVVTGLPGSGILLTDCLKYIKYISRLKRSNGLEEDDSHNLYMYQAIWTAIFNRNINNSHHYFFDHMEQRYAFRFWSIRYCSSIHRLYWAYRLYWLGWLISITFFLEIDHCFAFAIGKIPSMFKQLSQQ